MTIEQIIEIPADHRVSFDVPKDVPPGKARVKVSITPVTGGAFLERKQAGIAPENAIDERERGERKEYRNGVQRPPVSLLDLHGSCEGEDTLNAYFERKREENDDPAYPPGFPSWLKGAVSPDLYKKGKINGDIIGPFDEEWEKG
jgi:hypothetical protein